MKISVIIPARNEELFIKRAIDAYRAQEYSSLEIIVVVNNSHDRTFEIANEYADKTIHIPENVGVSQARNEGAKVAMGDMLVFSDADSYLSKGALKTLEASFSDHLLGTFFGKADKKSAKADTLFFVKNWTSRLRLYKGIAGGVMFCAASLYQKINGFDVQLKIGEYEDVIARAQKAGGAYAVISSHYAFTSMRRYESKGYMHMFLFWIEWKIASLFKKNNQLQNKYFNE